MPEGIDHRRKPDMIQKYMDCDLLEPVFEITSGSLVITLRKEISEELLRGKDLNDRQIKAVDYLKENETITRSKYESLFNCSKKTAHNDLKDLLDKEIIERKGEGKNTYYQIEL